MKKIKLLERIFSKKLIIITLFNICMYILFEILNTFTPMLYERIIFYAINGIEINKLIVVWLIVSCAIVIWKPFFVLKNNIHTLKMFEKMEEYQLKKIFLKYNNISEKGIGYYASLLTLTGKKIVSIFSIQILNAVVKLSTIMIIVVIIMRLNFICGIISIVFLMISFLLAKNGNKKYMEWANSYQEQKNCFFSDFVNTIEGARTSNIFKRCDIERNRFNIQHKKICRSLRKAKIVDFSYFFLGIDGIKVIYRLVIIVISFLSMYKGKLIVSEVVLIIYYCELIGQPVLEMLYSIDIIRDAIASINIIDNEFEKIIDEDKVDIKEINKIEFKNVSYTAPNGRIIFDNFCCKMEKGEVYAISAKSGKGKSTLVKMILGFIDNYRGEIIINNISKKNISNKSIYNCISALLQEAYVFNTSLYENVTFDKKISTKDMDNLVKLFKIEYLFKRKNIDLKTISGGEKSRILLLRTLLFAKEKDVIILDEPMEGIQIDMVNEICDKIKEEFKEKLIIIISHNKFLLENISVNEILLE